jgi:hypothetical protein
VRRAARGRTSRCDWRDANKNKLGGAPGALARLRGPAIASSITKRKKKHFFMLA